MDPFTQVKAFLDSDSETFSYVVADLTSGSAVIIDPVLDFDYKSGRTSTKSAEEILAYVEQKTFKVEWVLETHAHADHLSAAPFFKEKLGAKIGIGEHIQQVQGIFKQIFNLEKEFLPNGAQFDRLFKDGEALKVGSLSIRVMHTPGHTPADLAYIVNGKMAFVGDTLFMPDVGTAAVISREAVLKPYIGRSKNCCLCHLRRKSISVMIIQPKAGDMNTKPLLPSNLSTIFM